MKAEIVIIFCVVGMLAMCAILTTVVGRERALVGIVGLFSLSIFGVLIQNLLLSLA